MHLVRDDMEFLATSNEVKVLAGAFNQPVTVYVYVVPLTHIILACIAPDKNTG